MAQFVIPSIFTAVDKFSTPVRGMISNVNSFGTAAETAINRANSGFNKMTPALSEASKQFLSFASTAAAVGAALGTARFTTKAVMNYETEIANLSAITGTVGKDLDLFKAKIKSVSEITGESSIEVAKGFTMIGNNAPQLLKDANALAEVTKQSIILAQASKMELGPAADYLTKIMNQFNTPASEASKVVDLLASGMVVGSTDINKVSEAMLVFGGAAGQAGITLNESVVAIEAISDKVTDMGRLGTQFRNIFSRMEHASALDKTAVSAMREAGVNMAVLESKSAPLIDKLKELKKLQSVKGGMVAVFNEENQQALIPLLNSIPKLGGMLAQVNVEVEKGRVAQEMAAKNNQTFAQSWERLKNKFTTWVTTSEQAEKALNLLKVGLAFVSRNMSIIISVAALLIGSFVAIKTALFLAKIAMIGYNVVLGISAALTGAGAMAIRSNAVALGAYKVMVGIATAATWLWTAAQTAFNVAMMVATGPIGLVVLAVTALIGLFMSFRRNWDMIVKAFKTEGILGGLKAIGKTIIDAVLSPLQKLMEIIADFTGFDWASNAAKSIQEFRGKMGVEVGATPTQGVDASLNKSVSVNEPLNPEKTKSESFTERFLQVESKKIAIDLNLPKGADANVKENNAQVPIKLGSTVGFTGPTRTSNNYFQ